AIISAGWLAFSVGAADSTIMDSGARDSARYSHTKTITKESFIASNRWDTGSSQLRQAKKNYMLHCATCHGAKGDGQGELAEMLGEGIKPRDHTDAKVMSQRSDEDLRKVISDGGESMGFNSAMPPFSTTLSNEEIVDIVKYLRTLCKCKGP
ncbi:MAG: cytochrome c, partial [Nitrospinota bacterium]|nr:cytochrome c [Nitrospinota bacterium]